MKPKKAYTLVSSTWWAKKDDSATYRDPLAKLVRLYGKLDAHVDDCCTALLESENAAKRWDGCNDHEFLVIEVDVAILEEGECNFTADPDKTQNSWVCSAIPAPAVLHEYKVILTEGPQGSRPKFSQVNRDSKCPFPFIWMHDPGQAWKQYPGTTVVTAIALAVIYTFAGRLFGQAARRGIHHR